MKITPAPITSNNDGDFLRKTYPHNLKRREEK
jgi:hypothetical protein